MIILPFIPILALLVQTCYTLNDILDYKAEVAEIETQVRDNKKMREIKLN